MKLYYIIVMLLGRLLLLMQSLWKNNPAMICRYVVIQIWDMFEKMRAALLSGCYVGTTHTVHFCYSYSLRIEDIRVIQYSRNLLAGLLMIIFEITTDEKEKKERKCNDLKCVRKPTKSRLILYKNTSFTSITDNTVYTDTDMSLVFSVVLWLLLYY